mmetsp:Transcript_5336/g.13150  ORF Transcript_5336/g.13150 Transcript_5336/m.13150 type:complete len:221 (+) Transcript_5336:52-714(+)
MLVHNPNDIASASALERPVFLFFLETLDLAHVLLEFAPQVLHRPLSGVGPLEPIKICLLGGPDRLFFLAGPLVALATARCRGGQALLQSSSSSSSVGVVVGVGHGDKAVLVGDGPGRLGSETLVLLGVLVGLHDGVALLQEFRAVAVAVAASFASVECGTVPLRDRQQAGRRCSCCMCSLGILSVSLFPTVVVVVVVVINARVIPRALEELGVLPLAFVR